MSQGTNFIWNPLERILSADLNVAQTMAAAWTSDTARAAALSGLETFVPPYDPPFSRRGIVAGFAPIVSASADTLEINAAGALWAWNAAFPAIPPEDAGFSTYWRFAQLLEAIDTLTFALPVGVSFRWYLLEARVQNDAAVTALRDIKNTVTGLFVPTVVPVSQTQSVEFQLTPGVAGVDRIPEPSEGWVPIAAARAVAGGGVVPADFIYDLRRLPSDVVAMGHESERFTRGRFDFYSDGGTGAGNRKIFGASSEPHRLYGAELRASFDGIDMVDELFGAGVALTPGTELYIYGLAPLGIAPVRLDNPQQRGVFVISDLAPDRVVGGSGMLSTVWVSGAGVGQLHNEHFWNWTNSNTIGPQSAVLLGLVQVNSTSDGLDPLTQADGHVERTLLSGYDTATADGLKAFNVGIPFIAQNASIRAAFSSPVKTGVLVDGAALAGWYTVFSLTPAALGVVDSQSFRTAPFFTGGNVFSATITSYPAGPGAFSVSMWCEAFDW